jgi:hypothetical protein
MKFKNVNTGNILVAEDKATIALMQQSPNYEEVKTEAAKTTQGKASEGDKDSK